MKYFNGYIVLIFSFNGLYSHLCISTETYLLMRTTSGSCQQPDKILCLDLESIRCSDYSTINCKIMCHLITGSGLMPNYQNYLETTSDKPNDISKVYVLNWSNRYQLTNIYSRNALCALNLISTYLFINLSSIVTYHMVLDYNYTCSVRMLVDWTRTCPNMIGISNDKQRISYKAKKIKNQFFF